MNIKQFDKKYFWLLTVIVLISSCSSKNGSETMSFDKVVYEPCYASGFKIYGAEGRESIKIDVFNPWQGADSVTTSFLIVRGGEDVPNDYEGQVLRGEARRIVTMSSTQIAMLEAVDCQNRVVGVSGIDFISSENIQSRRESIGDLGYEGNVNYELLLSLEPDIVLLYGTMGANVMEAKLTELGIPFIYIGEYLEESPLGKAEWVVPVAEIVGKGKTGIEFFSEIPERYNALKDLVAGNASGAPSVMLNMPYNDVWNMPSTKSYMPQLIADAGGDYIYKKNTGNTSMPIDIEEAYMLASQADLWLNVGQAHSLDEVKAMSPKFTDVACLRNGNVYNNNALTNAGGGNEFFETAVVKPDIVLRDLIKIFHPELIEEQLVYYIKLK